MEEFPVYRSTSSTINENPFQPSDAAREEGIGDQERYWDIVAFEVVFEATEEARLKLLESRDDSVVEEMLALSAE